MNSDFDGFYTAYYGSTVTMVYGYTAELAEAQDIAQEAFCRAWQRWQRLSGYDNPAAWVRRVALNLAHSRWKRARRAAAHLIRQRADDVPPVDPEHVAVVAALRKLPPPQRKALVLHHLMDLPIDEVAEHLDAPVNTVKSWLHRGRHALAGELRVDIRDEIAGAPVSAVIGRARRRQAVRRAGWATAVAVLLAGALAAVWLVRPEPRPDPIMPTPSPSITVSPDPGPALPGTVTAQFTVTSSCPNGWRLTFVDQEAKREDMRVGLIGARWIDLTGDGRDELLARTGCASIHNLLIYPGRYTVLTPQPDGTLLEIGELPGEVLSVGSGVLHVEDQAPGRTAIVAWNGSAFVRSAMGGYPAVESLDLTGVTPLPSCGDVTVPSTLRITFNSYGPVAEDGRLWELGGIRSWITLRGKEYYLMDMTCIPEAYPHRPYNQNLFLLTLTATGWAVAGILPQPAGSEFHYVDVDGDRLTLTGLRDATAAYDWNGRAFHPAG